MGQKWKKGINMKNNKKALINESSIKNSKTIIPQTELNEEHYKCKDPALLFYTSDFIADAMFLSLEQVGKLALLMAHRHWQGRRFTRGEVLKICGDTEEDPEIFSRYEIDANGFYYNATVEKAIEKRTKYSKSRSDNKKGKTKTHKKNISKSYENHIENENENGIEDENESLYNNKADKYIDIEEIVYE